MLQVLQCSLCHIHVPFVAQRSWPGTRAMLSKQNSQAKVPGSCPPGTPLLRLWWVADMTRARPTARVEQEQGASPTQTPEEGHWGAAGMQFSVQGTLRQPLAGVAACAP